MVEEPIAEAGHPAVGLYLDLMKNPFIARKSKNWQQFH